MKATKTRLALAGAYYNSVTPEYGGDGREIVGRRDLLPAD